MQSRKRRKPGCLKLVRSELVTVLLELFSHVWQALERASPDLPMKPGSCAKREYEYIRHGTLCLIAALCVVTGQVFPWMNETRTEEDFVYFL